MRKQIANILTISRIVVSTILIYCPIFGVPFWILYSWCGLSDVLDGYVARKTDSASERGATTADAVQFGNDVSDGLSFNQFGNALQVPVAAAIKDDVVKNQVFANFKFNVFRTSPLCLVLVFHR